MFDKILDLTSLSLTICQDQAPVNVVGCHTHLSWAQLDVRAKHLWFWRDVGPNPFRIGCAQSISSCESGEMSHPTFSGSPKCQAQTPMSLARYRTQPSGARLRARPKCLQVWRDVQSNPLGLDYVLGSTFFWSKDSSKHKHPRWEFRVIISLHPNCVKSLLKTIHTSININVIQRIYGHIMCRLMYDRFSIDTWYSH